MPILSNEELRRREKERQKAIAEGRIDPSQEAERKLAGKQFIQAREKAESKGASKEDANAAANQQTAGQTFSQRTVEETQAASQQTEQFLGEQGVFKDTVQEPLIDKELQNLGVVSRIVQSVLGEKASNLLLGNLGQETEFNKQKNRREEAVSQAEINLQKAQLGEVITSEISSELDLQIDEAEQQITQFGIGTVGAAVGGAAIAGVFTQPISQFVGSDKTIANLEQALALYSEALSRPSTAIDAGLSPQDAFQKLNRMEAGIILLEQRTKLAALTSPNVAISMRGAGIETRLQNLKDRLQFERTEVAGKFLREEFGEKDLTASALYLRKLKEGKK